MELNLLRDLLGKITSEKDRRWLRGRSQTSNSNGDLAPVKERRKEKGLGNSL